MASLRWNGTADEFEALEAAVTRAVGACRCGPLRRRMGHLCNSCECLASLLASTDTRGRATMDRWAEFKAYPHILRLGEPLT